MPDIISASNLVYSYGKTTRALDGVSLGFPPGRISGLLGPNGSGKSTLFKLMTTLLRVQKGELLVCGHSVSTRQHLVRQKLGVVFQSPALDKKLTSRENLIHQGHLYGLRGPDLAARIEHWSAVLGIAPRLDEIVEKLSGGLQRRVEIAKALLHDPEILLMDEPSNGLDPLVRRDLWKTLKQLISKSRKTIVLSTHLMDEARLCHHLVMLDKGKVVGSGSPEEMIDEMGSVLVRIESEKPRSLLGKLQDDPGVDGKIVEGIIRIETQGMPAGRNLIAKIIKAYSPEIQSISLSKPTLEDVFVARAGRNWHDDEETEK